MNTVERNVLVVVVLLGFSAAAWGFPQSGINCQNCHTSLENDRATLFGEDGEISEGGMGPLKVFDFVPGVTDMIEFQIDDGTETYALQIKGFENAGLIGGNTLTFVPDDDWTKQGSSPAYYTNPGNTGFTWTPGFVHQEPFEMTVDEGTEDVYLLTAVVAGVGENRWRTEEQFFVRVIPEPATAVLSLVAATSLLYRRKIT